MDFLIEQDMRDRLLPAALICAQVWNVNNDFEKNPDGFTAADFLPGSGGRFRSKKDEMQEFIEALERGEPGGSAEDDEALKLLLKKQFSVRSGG